MKPSCQIVDRKDSQGFARYLAKNGQLLRPSVELIEASIRRCFCYVEKTYQLPENTIYPEHIFTFNLENPFFHPMMFCLPPLVDTRTILPTNAIEDIQIISEVFAGSGISEGLAR